MKKAKKCCNTKVIGVTEETHNLLMDISEVDGRQMKTIVHRALKLYASTTCPEVLEKHGPKNTTG